MHVYVTVYRHGIQYYHQVPVMRLTGMTPPVISTECGTLGIVLSRSITMRAKTTSRIRQYDPTIAFIMSLILYLN